MKRIFQSFLTLLIAASLSGAALSQAVGLELYAKMGERGFVNFDGTNISWLPENMGYLETEKDDDGFTVFYKVDPKSEKRSLLFDKKTSDALISQYNDVSNENVTGLPFDRFNFVIDNKAIFFTKDKTDYVFNLKDKKLRKLYKPEVERPLYTDELMRGMSRSQLWNGTYSHDYSKFAYIKEYDIYVVDTATKEEKRLTYGSEEKMNGRPSWVYPEEFGERDAYWFSPDNSKISYLQYQEKDVHQFPIVHELTFEAGLEQMRYPKAGETNPTVNLFIVDIESGEIEQVPTNSNPDTYIVRPIWRNDGTELTFRRLNRKQDHLELLAYDIEKKTVRTILEEREETYINLHDDFIQLDDNKTFIWTSERSGYNHVYHYDFSGKLISQITEGDFPVGQLVNVDQKRKKIYFTAFQNMGLDSYFYSIDMNGKNMKKLSKGEGRHRVSMNEAAEYYVSTHSSFDSPPEANLYSSNGKMIRNVMKADISNVEQQGLEKPEFAIMKAADGTTDLPVLIYKPKHFDPNKKYPVVLPLYGGPSYQDVSNTFKNYDGFQRLAQLGFIVVRANYRGSGNRGKAFQDLHYGRLGTLEIDDYAAVIEQVTEREYADGDRVGVYGHSYGGYATALLMLRYPNIFHVGISGAPVTDWRSYDTIYTERYMNTPQANKEGYDVGSAMKYASQLKGELLLIHGSIDNNVHPANTIMLVDALIKADKDFDLMMYPGNRHGIRGAHGRHYSKLRLQHLIENLNPEIVGAGETDFDLIWSN